ncbi:hypothetical protein [Vulcanisaeta sp. JCM 14467]|uniref:hypothetical protein n=1 Tax=Vulcanisaeta sp. JCM 14467 TaxID=1295370 RepID=UPI0006D23D74|nr:hypothetical protein [Vulcanisaeta sp. JCM 14467]
MNVPPIPRVEGNILRGHKGCGRWDDAVKASYPSILSRLKVLPPETVKETEERNVKLISIEDTAMNPTVGNPTKANGHSYREYRVYLLKRQTLHTLLL